jgi:hypothetical protein
MRIYVFIYLIFILFVFIGGRVYHLITDDNYYGWPAITQCRICDKTVWAWQKYERRSFTIKSNSSMITSASGITHFNCQGHPEFEINIEVK